MAVFESFRAVRWLRTINLVLQAVLFLTFFGGLNYVARNYAWRFDLTRQRKFSLSPETLSYIKNLRRPVHIVVSLSEENDNPEVRGLLDEYTYATESSPAGRITKEFLDAFQNRRRAEELGIGDTDMIVLVSGEKRHSLKVSELYQVKNQERSKFLGEQAITAAILDVSSSETQKIYFLVGHGEAEPNDTTAHGLSTLRDQLRVRNFEVDTLDLSVNRKVPDDASLLIAVAPSSQSSYRRNEQEMLRQYLSAKAGRLIFLLQAGASVARLGIDDLLLDWGVLVDDDVIWDTDRNSVTDDGDLIVRAFDKTHRVTQNNANIPIALRFGQTRSVRPDPGRTLGAGLNTVTLAAASPTAWGEVNYRSGVMQYDQGQDIRPLPGMKPEDHLGVAVASERVSVRDNLPFSVAGGRLVVFGTGDFISNQRLLNNGNLYILFGAVNWAVDRDRQLSIPARSIERFQLSLSARDFQNLRYALLFALPGGALLLGLLVYVTRRA